MTIPKTIIITEEQFDRLVHASINPPMIVAPESEAYQRGLKHGRAQAVELMIENAIDNDLITLDNVRQVLDKYMECDT